MAGPLKKVSYDDVPANRRRGGDIRILLSPRTVGSTSGFMGVGTLQPGEFVAEHRHPYSEEFMYVVAGVIVLVTGDGDVLEVCAGQGVMVPMDTSHRLENRDTETALAVFHTSPLAPRPELGHVDLAEPVHDDAPDPHVGGPRAQA